MEAEIKLEKYYLLIPVKTGGPKKKLEIWNGEKKLAEFRIPCGMVEEQQYTVDFYAPIAKSVLVGTNQETVALTLKGEFPNEFFHAVLEANKCPDSKEQRPAIHFTARTGWMNDPNGLIYENGWYHLYFQYNPFDTEWENMSWGHAVSRDLLTWVQLDTVMLPDQFGTIFSGSAILNTQGMLSLNQDALLYFYTAAGGTNDWSLGQEFTQRMAYSLDHGKTLIKKKTPVVPTIERENRDPKVFWHKTEGCYYMVLWLKENEFAVLRSDDLEEFSVIQTLELPGCFECPDLFELPVEGTKKSSWVFWSADGYYYICGMKNGRLTRLSERKEAYLGKLPYAAQTFSNTEGRTITIPWFRAKFVSRYYTGAMGLPRELSFITEGEEQILCQKPVREYEAARVLEHHSNIEPGIQHHSVGVKRDLDYAVEYEFILKTSEPLCLEFNKFNKRTIYFNRSCAVWRILFDGPLLEVWSEDGSSFLAEEITWPGTCPITIHNKIQEQTIYRIVPQSKQFLFQ